jgi:1-deoxy-D-xylulose-5-phosphate synthase
VVTKKGQGYKLAEADPVAYHGPGKFDPEVGLVKPATPPSRPSPRCSASGCATWPSTTSGWWASPGHARRLGHGRVREALPGATTTWASPSSTPSPSPPAWPARALKPVVAIYSTFLQRAYDQLIHDVALQNLPVVFALDRAGLVGADGATHAGAYDIAFCAAFPTWPWPARPTSANAASC